MVHGETRYCLFGVCEPLRDFRKAHSISQDRPFVCKNHWKQLGWGRVSENHPGKSEQC